MKKLERWLKEQGMSKAEFARQLGVHRSNVTRWLEKDGHKPNYATLVNMQRVTGLTPGELSK